MTGRSLITAGTPNDQRDAKEVPSNRRHRDSVNSDSWRDAWGASSHSRYDGRRDARGGPSYSRHWESVNSDGQRDAWGDPSHSRYPESVNSDGRRDAWGEPSHSRKLETINSDGRRDAREGCDRSSYLYDIGFEDHMGDTSAAPVEGSGAGCPLTVDVC